MPASYKTTLGVACLLIAFTAGPVYGQDEWEWPETPENLQVLPANWPGSNLSPVMRGFTNALGVRCSHCHVGEEGAPLSTYDFASDENPNKERAREMLRMLGSVNEHLRNIEPSGLKRVNMWCHTCHRGRPRPMTLAEELEESFQIGGIDAALEQYRSLKEQFYGRGAYDFGEGALNAFGYVVMESAGPELAIRIFELNAEQFPESANVWDSLGEGYMEAGDDETAIRHYTRSLELDPTNENARTRLERLRQ